MKILLLGLLIILIAFGCKINKTKNNMREGRRFEHDTVNGVTYKTKGRYKKNEKIKIWKFYANNKISKMEKYINNICDVTTFYPSGKIELKRQSKVEISNKLRHWFYFGE